MGVHAVQVSREWTGRIVRARTRRQAALEAFKAEIGPILDAASDRLRHATSLHSVEDYLAALLVFVKHQRDSRTIRDVLLHAGRVLGHDRRTINIEEPRSIREIVAEFQRDLAPRGEGGGATPAAVDQ